MRLARECDYQLVISRLGGKWRHPSFIGREFFKRVTRNGGCFFYELDGEIVAISIVNPRYGILNALNVSPLHRGHGLGKAIMGFLVPNFARVTESKVPWFEKLGYRKIGKLKRGISLNTQVMARSALFDLAGKLRKVWH